MKPSNDFEAVTIILNRMLAAGFTPVEVADDSWNTNERTPVSTPTEALEMVMAVDDAYVFFSTPDGGRGYIWFVLGNDPEEVVCDYTINLDPTLASIIDPWWS